MPLTAALVTGGIGLGSAIVKGIRARKQEKQGEKQLEQDMASRPVMGRTNASIEQEQQAREMANTTRLPGQSYAENAIGAETGREANKIEQTGGSAGEIIGGLTGVNRNALNSRNDLAYQGAQLNQENKQMFSNVLNNVSQDQKDIFDYNKNQPWQTKVLRQQAIKGAYNTNMNNAIDTGFNALNNGVTAYQYGQSLKDNNGVAMPTNYSSGGGGNIGIQGYGNSYFGTGGR